MIAALFVDADGIYAGRPDVDAWDIRRDARTYPGPYPVVAHPPCQRWGRWWWADGSTEPGNDGGGLVANRAAFSLPLVPCGRGWLVRSSA